jgi:16S rRNA (guanine966-N2)-methyltransferase
MLRITGGEWRGRRISAPRGRATRPTAEKVREALFDALSRTVELAGAEVWDLFAGSGALGIEALSRGAARVTFVEAHARTAAIIRGNLAQLGAEPSCWRLVTARVLPWLRKNRESPPPRVVLLDPPYGSGEAPGVLAELAASPLLAPDAVVVVEGAARDPFELPGDLELLRTRRYGDTEVRFVAKRSATAGPHT